MLLFVLAATSHDYWNTTLGGPLWKAIHMSVYLAYALIVLHIVFGALQQDVTGLMPWMIMASTGLVGGLHLLAALTRSGADRSGSRTADSWIPVGRYMEIPDNRAITVDIDGDERIAIFRYHGNRLCAVSNVCQHQNGPLGEGRVVDGLITCPLARISVSAAGRLFPAALHGKDPDLSPEARGRSPVRRCQPVAGRYAEAGSRGVRCR